MGKSEQYSNLSDFHIKFYFLPEDARIYAS